MHLHSSDSQQRHPLSTLSTLLHLCNSAARAVEIWWHEPDNFADTIALVSPSYHLYQYSPFQYYNTAGNISIETMFRQEQLFALRNVHRPSRMTYIFGNDSSEYEDYESIWSSAFSTESEYFQMYGIDLSDDESLYSFISNSSGYDSGSNDSHFEYPTYYPSSSGDGASSSSW